MLSPLSDGPGETQDLFHTFHFHLYLPTYAPQRLPCTSIDEYEQQTCPLRHDGIVFKTLFTSICYEIFVGQGIREVFVLCDIDCEYSAEALDFRVFTLLARPWRSTGLDDQPRGRLTG